MPPPIPEGFEPLATRSPGFMSLCGPVYLQPPSARNATPVLALRIEERHLNLRGIAHGGLLVTLADSALGYVLSHSRTPPLSLVSVSLATDFIEAALLGDWVEAQMEVQRIGQRVAFANGYLCVGERRILRASGIYNRARAPARSVGADG